jgi:hypothetical protein
MDGRSLPYGVLGRQWIAFVFPSRDLGLDMRRCLAICGDPDDPQTEERHCGSFTECGTNSQTEES